MSCSSKKLSNIKIGDYLTYVGVPCPMKFLTNTW